MFSVSSGTRAGVAWGLLSLVSCANPLSNLVDPSSDEYRIAETRKALDRLDFDNAITNISPVLARRSTEEEIAYLASAAYAGRAGLRLLDLFSALTSDLSSKTLLTIFAQHYEGATDENVADMETAVSIIEAYGPRAANRSVDLNFYALFLFYSRMGVILNRYAFNSSNTLRVNFHACHTVEDLDGPETGLPNDMLDRVMTAIPRIVETIPAIGSGSGLPTGALDTSLLPAVPFDPVPCTTDPNNSACLLARLLVLTGSPSIGLGTGEIPCLAVTP